MEVLPTAKETRYVVGTPMIRLPTMIITLGLNDRLVERKSTVQLAKEI